MNKSMFVGVVLGGIAATSLATFAGYQYMNQEQAPAFAEVLKVNPVEKTYTTPRQECDERVVTRTKPVQDENQIAGTALGAVVGGVIGNQIGGGSGKKIATIAGAAAGGYAGKKTQENMQRNDTYTEVVQDCRTVNDKYSKVIGYDVEYKLGDTVNVVRMDYDPGEQIPVKDGLLVLEKPKTVQ